MNSIGIKLLRYASVKFDGGLRAKTDDVREGQTKEHQGHDSCISNSK
jgi:hypothetical protein